MTLAITLHHDAPPLDLAVELPEREIIAVVGPSGSGKTSLLRAVAGLLAPRSARIGLSGDLWIDTAHGIAKPTRERPIGYVSQHYGLFPHLSALGNVAAALTHLPRDARLARARACLAQAHVAGLDDRLPRRLSGGQQQRVAMARALAREPQLLLLDEPFSAVDRSTRKRLYVELKRLHEELAPTVLLVTHDLDEAALLASHLCLLSRGRIVQHGPTREVMARPASVQAARLLDLPNLFDATVQKLGTDHVFPGKLGTDHVFPKPEKRGPSPISPITLRWGPHSIAVTHASAAAVGTNVAWTIPVAHVLLHRVDRPSRGEHENPVPGKLVDLVTLGDDVIARLAPLGLPDARLSFKVSQHVAERNGLAPGRAITVSLLADAIAVVARD